MAAQELRELLKEYIPMYLWETLAHPEGYVISNTEFNTMWNLAQVQGDQQASTIRDLLHMLYETILNDEDGATHLRVDLPEFNVDNLKQVLLLIDERLKAGVTALSNHKDSADHDHRYYTEEELNNNKLGSIYYTKAQLSPLLAGGSVPIYTDKYTIVSSDNGDETFTYLRGGEEYVGNIFADAQEFTIVGNTYKKDIGGLLVYVDNIPFTSIEGNEVIELTDTTFALKPIQPSDVVITIKYINKDGIIAVDNVIQQLADIEQGNIDFKNEVDMALDELFIFVSEGKELIAAELTDKKIHASSDDTFEKLSLDIRQVRSVGSTKKYSTYELMMRFGFDPVRALFN